jgi:hypothetical protein
MILAGIGRLWDTLEDRSILITLERKKTDERLERLSLKRVQTECLPIRRKIARWVKDHGPALDDPIVPESLNDRAADNWRPLVAIADLLGVGDEAREAAIKLSGGEVVDDSEGIRLLNDLRSLFHHQDKYPTKVLITALESVEEAPWGDYRAGKPITAQQLAKRLKPFSIGPKQHWFEAEQKNIRGYAKDQFQEAFSRYLPLIKPEDARGAREHENTEQTGDSESARPGATSGSKINGKCSADAGSSGSSGLSLATKAEYAPGEMPPAPPGHTGPWYGRHYRNGVQGELIGGSTD